MPYECRIERDSVGPDDCGRAVTWVVRFPRRVLAETVTHRLCSQSGEIEYSLPDRTTTREVSKNSASSRAIPFERMVKSIEEDPFVPQWTKNQKGMQGDPLGDQVAIDACNHRWMRAMEDAIAHARKLHDMGVHKQDCNRLLEPFAWTTQVITMTRPDNFFALRTHHAADPHFRTIARMMYLAMIDSTPQKLDYGQWHLPFTPASHDPGLPFAPAEPDPLRWWIPLEGGRLKKGYKLHAVIRQSAARCAWVSYENHDKDASQEACDRTFDRLLAEIPVHASPVEHQLTPLHPDWREELSYLQGNCAGWVQARKLIPHEAITNFVPSSSEVDAWREEVKQWYGKEGP